MIPRYELTEELPAAELFRLERGRDRESGRPVLIKTPRNEATRAIAIESLRRESNASRPFQDWCFAFARNDKLSAARSPSSSKR